MFSQVERTLERNSGGLGIGLALVKGLVEMHRGTVTAQSDGQGRGSTFTVRLPVLDREPAPAALDMPEEPPAQAGPKRRILVVDDNRDAAMSMATLLKLMANDVRTAHSGPEALSAAESFHPELVLMDVGMPVMDGYETTRRIREQPWGKRMAVYALTGWGQEADRLKSQDAGCSGHLVKPVNLRDLERILADLPAGSGPDRRL
jgi:CheY-like chemotaxis protein